MKLDGQLESAQLEEISSASPTPAARSRIYSDITDTSNIIPRFYDGSLWVPVSLRRKTKVAASTTHAMAETTEILICDATSAAFTVTLPTAASMAGRQVYIQKSESTFNAVTIDGNGAELIDGQATTPLSTYQEYVVLWSTGTGWLVLQSGYYGGKTSFTPTGSWSTNTTYTGYWWRTGNRINFEIKIALAGAPTAAALTVNMPTGTTIASSVMAGTDQALTPYASLVTCYDLSATDQYIGFVYYNNTSTFALRKDDGDGTFSNITQAAPVTFATGDLVEFTVTNIPVANWRG